MLGELFCAVFQKISGSEKVYGWEGGCQKFPLKFFLSQVPKIFVGESFIVSLIPGIEKLYASAGYVTIFSRIFCQTVPKIYVEEPFCTVFQKFSGSQKVYG